MSEDRSQRKKLIAWVVVVVWVVFAVWLFVEEAGVIFLLAYGGLFLGLCVLFWAIDVLVVSVEPRSDQDEAG